MSSKILTLLPSPALAIALGLATAVRVIYWLAVADQPWFQTPGMDPEFYRTWASAILAGHGAEYIPFPRAPLYSYLLAGILKLSGSAWLLPRLFNLIFDLVTVGAIWSIGKKIGGNRAGFIAALLFALCGMAIYQSGELLMTSLEMALAALYLLMFIRTLESGKISSAAASGLLLGLFALCRPNALVLMLLAPLVLVLFWRKELHRGLILAPVMATIGLLVIAPATYLNYVATAKLVPVATQGGVNFFIGNARGANGWASSLPGVGSDWVDADAERITELDAGKPLETYQESRQLWKMGLAEIKADPVAWTALMARKFLLLNNIREIGNNRPLALPIEAAPFLRLLFLISVGGLLPFAIVGFVQTRKNRAFAIGSLTFIMIYGGSLLLFFISSRYRMPLMPIVAVLAGVGVTYLFANLANLLRRSSLIALTVGLVIAVPPWGGTKFENPAQGYFVVGNALQKQGRYAEAMQYYARSASLEPGYPKLHLNMGVALMASGDTLVAAQEFQIELSLSPERGEALNNLAVIAESRGDLTLAKEYYRRASEMEYGGQEALENLIRVVLKQGDDLFQHGNLESATSIYQEASSTSLTDPRPLYRMALIAATKGEFQEARGLAREALIRDREYQPASKLLAELPLEE